MSKAQLYKKISEVMKDVEYLQKDDKVSVGQGQGYKAISEEKVTMTVRESLIKHGLVILPVDQEHLREPLLDAKGEHKGYLTTVNTKYEIVDIETGESKIIVSSGTGSDSQDKGVGKAMTYSYKYLLLRTFAIPTGEDPDKVSSQDLDDQHQKKQEASQPKQAATETRLDNYGSPYTVPVEQPKEINWKEKNEQQKNAAQEVGQQKLSEALQRDVMGLMKKRGMSFPDLNEFCTAMLERPVKFFKKDVVDVAELKQIKAAMDDAVGA